MPNYKTNNFIKEDYKLLTRALGHFILWKEYNLEEHRQEFERNWNFLLPPNHPSIGDDDREFALYRIWLKNKATQTNNMPETLLGNMFDEKVGSKFK